MSLLSEEDLDNILNRDFLSSFRFGYVKVKGFTLPKRFEDLKKDIYEVNVSESDVWVCSFPKTGTTWTQEMVWMIMNHLDFEKGKEPLYVRSPFLDHSILYDYRKLKKENSDFQPPPYIDESIKFVSDESKKGPLCVKTHLPWSLLPKEIQENTKKPKIIYVTRNPKDTCISYFNHCKLMEGYKGSFEDFCELFLAGKLTFAPYWNHVLPFWRRRNQPNILFLKYEKMIQDLPSVIKEVAEFLEKPLSDEEVKILTDHLSFDNMKKNPAVNYEEVIDFNKKFKLIESEGSFMRSGKVGDYKAKMSHDIVKRFDEWIERNTRNTDYQ